MSWSKVKIGDFLKRSKIPIDIENNKSYKRVTIRTKHQGVSLRDEEIGKKIGTKKQFVLKEGQFVLSKIDARYGAFGIAPAETNGAIITGNFWAYDVDKSMMNINWLNQYTNSPAFYDLCERASSGITHRKYLNEDFFLNHELMIPDIDEQDSHVVFIESRKKLFGDLEYSNTYQLDLLKKLHQQILQDAVQGKLVPQDPNDEPASELLERIKAEKEKLVREKKIKKEKTLPPIKPEEIPFEIPNNWIWCRLGEIVEYTVNKDIHRDFSHETLINYVDIDAIDNQHYKIRESKIKSVGELSSRARRVLKEGFILYSLVRPYLNNIAIIENEKDNYIGSTGFAVFSGIMVDNKYVKHFLLSDYVRKKYLELLSGFNSPSITFDAFNSTIFPLPPLKEQTRIVTKIEQLMKICDELEQSIQQNLKYTQELLQVALKEALEQDEFK